MEITELIETIVDCAKTVRSKLVHGYEEKVYKNAMFIEMKKRGLKVETEVPFEVRYDGIVVGQYRSDMIVDRRVILELKAITNLNVIHSVQLVNYLNVSGIEDGLLINFGSEKLEIKHKTRTYHLPV